MIKRTLKKNWLVISKSRLKLNLTVVAGVLATVPKKISGPILGNPSNVTEGILNAHNELNLQRKKNDNNKEEASEYGVLCNSAVTRNPSPEYYGNFVNGSVISMSESPYNGNNAMGQHQFQRYVIDGQSRSFQTYRSNSSLLNLNTYETVANHERSYGSPSLENSPEGYTQSQEMRTIENHSNSMNAPFENMGIHPEGMDSPNLISQCGSYDAASQSFIRLDSVGNASEFNFQTNAALSNNDINAKFLTYKDGRHYAASNMYGDNESEFGNRPDKENFVTETRNSVQEEKSNT